MSLAAVKQDIWVPFPLYFCLISPSNGHIKSPYKKAKEELAEVAD